jgi:hypothetical protein
VSVETKLEYQSDITETNKLICERYWLREGDKRSGFIYTCKEIGQEFDVKHQDIPRACHQLSQTTQETK